MQRIEVTREGITVTSVTEPLISMYGKEMRPGVTSVSELPWEEVSSVALSVLELPPDAERWVQLTVDLTWGEYFELNEDAEGFADAVRELCRLSGLPVPDLAAVTPAGQVIWPGPEPTTEPAGLPESLVADLERLRSLPDGPDRNLVLHRMTAYSHEYHDALRQIRSAGPGRLRAVALEALAQVAGEAGLSAADIATIERLIAIKAPTDPPSGIDACWNHWICVPGGDQAGIIEELGLTRARPVTFTLGASVIEGQTHGADCDLVFVTPQINGWTAVVGTWCDPVDDERHAEVKDAVERLSARFGEAHAFYFGSQNDGTAWLVARDGATIRRFSDASADWAIGEPLPIEQEHLARVGLTGSPEHYLASTDRDVEEAMYEFTFACTAREVAGALSLNIVWWQPSDVDASGQGLLAAVPGAVNPLVPPGAFDI